MSCVYRPYKLFSDDVTEKEEEFEEKLWKWQEFQNEMDSCFRNLAVIEKSLDFQSSFEDAELEDRAETNLVSFHKSESFSHFTSSSVNVVEYTLVRNCRSPS